MSDGPGNEDGRVAFKHWISLLANPRIGRAQREAAQLIEDMSNLGEESFAENWAYLFAEWRADPEATRRKLDAAYGAAVDQGLERLDSIERAKSVH